MHPTPAVLPRSGHHGPWGIRGVDGRYSLDEVTAEDVVEFGDRGQPHQGLDVKDGSRSYVFGPAEAMGYGRLYAAAMRAEGRDGLVRVSGGRLRVVFVCRRRFVFLGLGRWKR